jgi:hypothetical protein
MKQLFMWMLTIVPPPLLFHSCLISLLFHIVVLQNMDELFDLTPVEGHIYAALDCCPGIFFNPGMMVIKPSARTYFALQLFIQDANSTIKHQGVALNEFFHYRWSVVHSDYNTMRQQVGAWCMVLFDMNTLLLASLLPASTHTCSVSLCCHGSFSSRRSHTASYCWIA